MVVEAVISGDAGRRRPHLPGPGKPGSDGGCSGVYCRKILLSSVTGEPHKMEEILLQVKRYGAALVTLEAARLIRQESGCNLTLGASNVSSGLSGRGAINAAFLPPGDRRRGE